MALIKKIFLFFFRAGPLAQSAERGADNAKVVSSTLTRTKENFSFTIHIISAIPSAQTNLLFPFFLTTWSVFTCIRTT